MVQQGCDFNMVIFCNLLLLASYLFAKRCCICNRVLKIVLRIGVRVNTDGQNVSGTGPLEAIRTGEIQLSIPALDVITIEGISRQTVLSCNHCYVGFQRCCRLAFQHIAAPDLYERTVAEEPDIPRPTAR